jgi:hypothetical protein
MILEGLQQILSNPAWVGISVVASFAISVVSLRKSCQSQPLSSETIIKKY